MITMADDGFDPCECTWSHEMAMRRLLSILRQTQAYCTDTECYDEIVPRGQTLSDGSDSNFMFVAICWLVLAFAMIFLRPRMRNGPLDFKTQGSGQGRSGGGEDEGSPPPPAPPTY
ncbi:small integral membrane protein 14 isoform X2 [Ischnura elegans]|uniref:small integral membrane protein 14 isoform X2 n=1 Tax=Ischnura elegans TaxID=197161 RepID=UPI001ED8820F|nr:small integral membrane protein 14 isoform X2 [Ischnura elegans]